MDTNARQRILFICMGNICRSPTVEGIARAEFAHAGLDVEVDSAGTEDYHVGEPPDERAIRAAAARRAREGHPLSGVTIHHSDAGSQYTAIHFTETLMLAGLIPSVGTVGDALDNALAETTIGLYKTECVREDSPFRNGPIRTLADLEDITSAWVAWYNASRLMHRLGRRPPAEAEAEYYAHLQVGQHTDHT